MASASVGTLAFLATFTHASHVVGLLHRLHAGKQVVQIFDYLDGSVPMLVRMFQRRRNGYRDLGYSVTGAIPTVERPATPSEVRTEQTVSRRRLVKPALAR